MKDYKGNYITINCWNQYFSHVVKMILEHYDTKEYSNAVFILGSYIFHDLDFFKDRYEGKKIIIYQMEQLFLAHNEPHWVDVTKVVKRLKKISKSKGDEIWEMCSINSAFLKQYDITPNKLVPLRYTKSLEELDHNVEPEIDLFFYGNLNERRSKVLARLAYLFYFEDVSIAWVAGMDFDLQKKYIEKSKIILNLHHTETFNRQEQPRIFYALINKKCILSEPSQKNYFKKAIIETEDFSSSVKKLLKNDSYRKQGEKGYEIFKKLY